MGSLAPWSANARPSAQAPINTRGNFSVHMSWRGLKIFKTFPINFLAISGESKHFFLIKKTLKNKTPGVGMVPKNVFTPNFVCVN
jgi:hypothetical protein